MNRGSAVVLAALVALAGPATIVLIGLVVEHGIFRTAEERTVRLHRE